MAMNQEITASFDAAASSYDDEFTFSEIGKLQRERVYHWVDKSGVLTDINTIFEVNCGTGYDAEQFNKRGKKVIATDASTAMVNVAKLKRNKEIEFYKRDFNDISIDNNVSKSDFVFSNFGGLNCLDKKELKIFFSDLALKQKSGNKLAVVIMPEHCIVEDVYLLFKGKFSEIGRRSRKTHLNVDVNGEKIKTFYHSPRSIKALLNSNYKINLIKPIAHFYHHLTWSPFLKRKSGYSTILVSWNVPLVD